jgi:tRNA(Ile)-lysidine synthase
VSTTLAEKFSAESNFNKLFRSNNIVLVAISGGIDSVVLTHLLLQIQQPIALAHCNFMLRGQESNRDEAFVESLACKWNIPLHIKRFDTRSYAEENKCSIQVAARQLRYAFFEEVRTDISKNGATALIATAHHANDSVETMLMNLFRGTGIDGLRGIPARNGHIIRPLLFAYRHEVEAYAKEHKLIWVEDSSNQKEDYTRNYIRHTILPAIEKEFPQVLQNMQGSMQVFKDVAALYHESIEKKLKKLLVHDKDMQKVPVRKLENLEQAGTLLFEWLRPYGFTEGNSSEVYKLLKATNGSYVASASHRVIRNRAWLILAPLAQQTAALQVADALPFEMVMPDGKKLMMQAAKLFKPGADIPRLPANEVLLDAAQVQFPFIIRPWKQGDYFYPLGMAKKKKVARFLIDQKLSPIEKENIWVVETNKRVCWIVGYRMDDRFKITGKTSQIIGISVS